MNELYIAKLRLSFGEHWSTDCNFSHSRITGKFTRNEVVGVYEGVNEETDSWIQVPFNISVVEKDNYIEIVQGFKEELDDFGLENLKLNMKSRILSLLNDYKANYMKGYNRKVSVIENSVVA